MNSLAFECCIKNAQKFHVDISHIYKYVVQVSRLENILMHCNKEVMKLKYTVTISSHKTKNNKKEKSKKEKTYEKRINT